MRITVDHGGDAVSIVMSRAGVAETRALSDGISAEVDAQGLLVSLTIQGVARLTGAPDVLAELTIGVSSEAAHAAVPPSAPPPAAPAARRPLPPAERGTLGPLTWEAEAEAAMAAVPFFQRGARRRAIVELARARGLSQVTAAAVEESARRR